MLRTAVHAVVEHFHGRDLDPFLVTLDARVRDHHLHPVLRAEVAAGLMRAALTERRWVPNALSCLRLHKWGEHAYADELTTRLAGIAVDQFGDNEAVLLLQEAVEESLDLGGPEFELGLVSLGHALNDHDSMAQDAGFEKAERFLHAALERAPERRDARLYLRLMQAGACSTRAQPGPR